MSRRTRIALSIAVAVAASGAAVTLVAAQGGTPAWRGASAGSSAALAGTVAPLPGSGQPSPSRSAAPSLNRSMAPSPVGPQVSPPANTAGGVLQPVQGLSGWQAADLDDIRIWVPNDWGVDYTNGDRARPPPEAWL
ncbi:MAG: hypothetical protein ACRDJU_10720 [Actinomycetota bacterium]